MNVTILSYYMFVLAPFEVIYINIIIIIYLLLATVSGYAGVYKRRTGSYSDGCAIFYRDSKLKLLQWKGLEYYQKKVKVLNRDNVAVLAKFAVIEKR